MKSRCGRNCNNWSIFVSKRYHPEFRSISPWISINMHFQGMDVGTWGKVLDRFMFSKNKKEHIMREVTPISITLQLGVVNAATYLCRWNIIPRSKYCLNPMSESSCVIWYWESTKRLDCWTYSKKQQTRTISLTFRYFGWELRKLTVTRTTGRLWPFSSMQCRRSGVKNFTSPFLFSPLLCSSFPNSRSLLSRAPLLSSPLPSSALVPYSLCLRPPPQTALIHS